MAGLYNPTKDLYGSIWGKPSQDGLYESQFARGGASPTLKSHNQRLGQTPTPIDLTAPVAAKPAPTTEAPAIWEKRIIGFPIWIYLLVIGTYLVVRKK